MDTRKPSPLVRPLTVAVLISNTWSSGLKYLACLRLDDYLYFSKTTITVTKNLRKTHTIRRHNSFRKQSVLCSNSDNCKYLAIKIYDKGRCASEKLCVSIYEVDIIQ